MANYNLTKMAVDMYCPGNTVQLDEAGLPSILVYIPAFKNSDVLKGGDDSIHPAFIVNGRQIPGFYYSKYENVVYNGCGYSLPAENPEVGITFEKALECSEAKGYGWHLSTAAEWAAVALWSKKNGTQPYGNNNNGKDAREDEQKAIPTAYDSSGKIERVATGTGPLTWSHDGTASGVWDMNGNVMEWQGGIRLVWGELQILADNNAADPDNPQNNTSTCWKAINAADGTLVDPESAVTDTAVKATGSTVKLDCVNNVWTYSTGITTTNDYSCLFNKITCDSTIGDAAKVLLRVLALLPDEGAGSDEYGGEYVWWHNGVAERSVSRGGHFLHGQYSGMFSIYGRYDRNAGSHVQGFRATYIPNL